MKRFNLFGNPDGDILKHATRIKLDVMSDESGRIWMSYELHGEVSHFEDDEADDAGGTCCEAKPDAAELADDLLRRFVLAKGGRS